MKFLIILLAFSITGLFGCSSLSLKTLPVVVHQDVSNDISKLSSSKPSQVIAHYGKPYGHVYCNSGDENSYYELRYPVRPATNMFIRLSASSNDRPEEDCTVIRFYKKNSYRLGTNTVDATSNGKYSCSRKCSRGGSSNQVQHISVEDFESKMIN